MLCTICSDIFASTKTPDDQYEHIHHANVESLVKSKDENCTICLNLWSKLSEDEILGQRKPFRNRPDRFSEYELSEDDDDGCWNITIRNDWGTLCSFRLLPTTGRLVAYLESIVY
jgi:hypothetical protein